MAGRGGGGCYLSTLVVDSCWPSVAVHSSEPIYALQDPSPMALGAVTPLTSLFLPTTLCSYFGGDLQIISMENYGTDAYLHLNRLGNSQEPLP